MVVVVDVRVEPGRAGAEVERGWISPSSARSGSVWYTVRNEIPGICSLAIANNASAVGMLLVAVQQPEQQLALRRHLQTPFPEGSESSVGLRTAAA